MCWIQVEGSRLAETNHWWAVGCLSWYIWRLIVASIVLPIRRPLAPYVVRRPPKGCERFDQLLIWMDAKVVFPLIGLIGTNWWSSPLMAWFSNSVIYLINILCVWEVREDCIFHFSIITVHLIHYSLRI